MIITLDAETYFDDEYKLKRKSTDKGLRMAEYVFDDRFKVQGWAAKIADKPGFWLSHNQTAILLQRLRASGEKIILLGQNLKFDGLILATHYGFVPDLYVDTLGMARAVIGRRSASHGLEALSRYIGREGKVGGGDALMRTKGVRDIPAALWQELGIYAIGDVDETKAVFDWLKPHFPADEYIILDQTIRAFCCPRLRMDPTVLEPALQQLQAERAALAPSLGYTEADFKSKDKFAALLKMEGVAQPPSKVSPSWHKKPADQQAKLMAAYNTKLAEGEITDKLSPDRTWAFSKKDRDFVDMGARMQNPRLQKLIDARLTYASNIEVTRQAAYLSCVNASHRRLGDHYWPVDLNFSGAMNTHRLSGAEGGGGNPQNLGRKSPIRKAIRAGKGELLIVADLSGIELRTCAALAGDQKTLQQVRDDDAGLAPDPYCLFATDLYGEPISKPNDTMTKDVQSFMKDARTVGKISKLSLQYGVGWMTAVNTLWTWGVEIEDEFGQQMVDFYRKSHREITTLWKTMENFIFPAIQQGAAVPLPTCPLMETRSEGLGIAGMLPIWYPDLRCDEVYDERFGRMKMQWSYRAERPGSTNNRQYIYGGMAVENMSQYTAWKVMGYHWREIKRRLGLDMCLNVHDELVFVAPASEAEAMAKEVLSIMRTPPPWWPDLPVNAEVEVGEVYAEAK